MKSLFKNLLLKNSSPKQIVFKNTLWMLGSDIIIRLLKFLLIPIASRILQPEGFGIFNYSLTLVAAFFMLADLGLSTILRREYHQYDNRKPLITSVFFLKCLLWIMTVIVSSVAFFFLKDPVVKTLFFVFVGKYLFDEIKQFFLNLAIIQHRMELQAGILSMEAIIVTTVGLYFLFTTQSIFHFAIAYFLGSLVSVIVLLFFLKSLHFNIGKLEIKHIKKVSKLSSPFILVALVGMVYVSSDTLMIKWILGNEAVGYYTASFKLLGIISLSFAYIYKTITPLMNEVYNNHGKLIRLTTKGISICSLLAIPSVFCSIYFSDFLITQLYGSSFIPAIPVLKIMLIYLYFGSILIYLNHTLEVLRLEVKNLYITSGSILLNILLNLFFIPKFGIQGAAFATLIAKVFDLILTYRLCYSRLQHKLIEYRSLFTYLSISSILIFILSQLEFLVSNTYLLMAFSLIFYSFCLLLIKEKYMQELIVFLKNKVL